MTRPPNILLIMTDQQRYDSLGHAHAGESYTPFLDALARDGVLFENAYASATSCVPSRTSLLTGILPHRLPQTPVLKALPEGCWTVARALQQAGYETGLFGKMHLEPMRADHGFDQLKLCEHLTRAAGYAADATDDYREWLLGQGKPDPRFKNPGEPKTFAYEAAFHPTSWVTGEAAAFLDAPRERPYFAVVSYPHPHTPYDPPEPYASMYPAADIELPGGGVDVNRGLPQAFVDAAFPTRPGPLAPKRVSDVGEAKCRAVLASIRGLVRHIDDSICDLMRHVDLADTLVCFTSDHGDYGGHRGFLGKMPWLPFDDLSRVPLIFAGVGVKGGQRVVTPVQAFDFALTALDVAGVAPPAAEFDSVSLRNVLRGDEAAVDRPIISATNQGWPMLRRGRYKHIWNTGFDHHVLFDMDADPNETRNLAPDPAFSTLVQDNIAILDELMSKPAAEELVPRSARATGRATGLLGRVSERVRMFSGSRPE